MTLVEILLATMVSGLLFAAVMSMTSFSARSFAALSNYVDLDRKSRNALDRMSQDIRQADVLTNFTSNTLVFQTTTLTNTNKVNLTYTYSPSAKTLTRTFNGQSKILLTGCNYYHHDVFQRNPTNATFNQYPLDDPSRPDLAKVIQLTWICSRDILGHSANTESVQSAKIVIRKD